MTARTRCRWVKIRKCRKRFPLKLKWVVHKSYVRPEILYGSEAWCLKGSEMGI